MHHLIYSSTSAVPFSEEQLHTLLSQARANNEQQGLTGILLYHAGQFMQLLEGPPAAVHALYNHIAQDPRHTGIIKLADKPVENRSFPDWSMAFRVVNDEQFNLLLGYQSPETTNIAPSGLSAADSLLLGIMHAFMLRDDSEQETPAQ
ncbi:BLUF domain-containing protein [Hymenobacter sediminicola]|uniref:BLUF domain-containing protein n=1 Tax=Hymenobacter sediminicola TaxID=2761579 RepID=A0A7G7W6D8_9BACT|nr:BLUF domain-containing protein [Hymenobacter sediminicola]QNH61931.1 BLUF domain-containing protein [Hymenobacter sediminicola]